MDRIEKRKQTQEKRNSQTCKVFEVKIDYSRLSKDNKTHLYSLFNEAKWFYNYCLSLDKVNEADCTIKSVTVKVKDAFEEREFKYLTGQMKQAIKARLFVNLKSLSTKKKKGEKVGWLKFKSQIDSIPLVNLGNNVISGTFYIDKEHSSIRIQKMKSWLRVRGLDQIPDNVEIANATLVRKNNDYYLHITTFTEKVPKQLLSDLSVGIDFGCITQLTFSNGIKVEFNVPVNKKIKKLDRKIKRHQANTGKERPESKKKRQDREKRKKEYEHLANKKGDIRKKVVHAVTHCYKYVCVQDESIHAWQAGNHGKKIQGTAIGGILSDLKNKSDTPLVVSKWFASTKKCPKCGKDNVLSENERTYKCQCGFEHDRDVKSAHCIEVEAMSNKGLVPTDHREVTAREIASSTFHSLLSNISGVVVKQEQSVN